MKIRMDELIKGIATALDAVEEELLGASTHHGKRIAVLCALMGRKAGMEKDQITGLVFCALLHDNALTEYILSEYEKVDGKRKMNMKIHCELGERNMRMLGMDLDIRNYILYHHEQADGKGPMGKKEGEFPFASELISIADRLDVTFHLQNRDAADLPEIRKYIEEKSGTLYTRRASQAMLNVLDEDLLPLLKDEKIMETAARIIPEKEIDANDTVLIRIAEFIARIIDYKSNFTKNHSQQIAYRSWLMSDYYGFDEALRSKVFLAASLHDIGKLKTPKAILEKNEKLNKREYRIIQEHALHTYDFLKDINGFEDICQWASSHHEKLDGSGYPFGKKAEDLDFICRLIACLDIYQAITEERPYHPRRSHDDTMNILFDMASAGTLDKKIVEDLDKVMSGYSNEDVPDPALFSIGLEKV